MDQGGGVERLARLFAGHLRGGQPAQLVVHEREQFGGRLAVTAAGGLQ